MAKFKRESVAAINGFLVKVNNANEHCGLISSIKPAADSLAVEATLGTTLGALTIGYNAASHDFGIINTTDSFAFGIDNLHHVRKFKEILEGSVWVFNGMPVLVLDVHEGCCGTKSVTILPFGNGYKATLAHKEWKAFTPVEEFINHATRFCKV